jgi:hypothetical protein
MFTNYLCTVVLLFSLSITRPATAQPFKLPAKTSSTAKPFKILTSGRKITIQSKQPINAVIVWTANGHRLVEQKDINTTSFSFEITVNQKIFFARIDLGNGKMYTEKIGIQ